MDKKNVSHIIVLTTLHGLCELSKTNLFKKKTAVTTISKTKDDHYFFETVGIHDWNCDPKNNPNNAGNADNVQEFMDILKQQEYYDYVRFGNGGMRYDDIVEQLCSPEDTSFEKLEPARLTDFIKGTALIGRHILTTDEKTALGINQPR